MKATYIVTFDGFSEKSAAVLDKMLRTDIARYPELLDMTSATVVAARQEKKNAQSGRR